MQMGYNTDVDHLGVTVHAQTEDHGLGDSKITTQVFYGGRILDSRTISYTNAVNGMPEDERDTEIKRRMRAIHKHFLNKIHEGAYNEKLPIDSSEVPEAPPTTQPAPTQGDQTLTQQLERTEEAPVDIPQRAPVPTVDTILDVETRTWRGYEGDLNTPLATSIREALGA